MAIKFFGTADRQNKRVTGDIRSEYPAWYHPVRMEILEEEVKKGEHQIKSGAINKLPNTEEFRMELERKRVLLDTIKSDKPVLNGKDKDRAANAYRSLTARIRELMPTYTDMHKGLANAHEENKKDHSPCVDVQGFVDIARECGVKVPKGESAVTRKQATRIWKIVGAALGERTNVEHLRQDENTGTLHSERSIDQMIREDN